MLLLAASSSCRRYRASSRFCELFMSKVNSHLYPNPSNANLKLKASFNAPHRKEFKILGTTDDSEIEAAQNLIAEQGGIFCFPHYSTPKGDHKLGWKRK